MLPLLLALAFAPATHPAVSCDEVRRVRAAAVAQGLDDGSLRVLESQVCASPGRSGRLEDGRLDAGHLAGVGRAERPPRGSHHDRPSPYLNTPACIDLEIMSLLAGVGGASREHVEEIEALAEVACSLGLDEGTVRWRSGLTARSATDGWSWPSGITAKTSTGGWNWPNGITAKSTSGSWSWPNGITAVSSTGRWSAANGVSTTRAQLVGDACRRDGRRCDHIALAAERHPDLGTAALLHLAWSTR